MDAERILVFLECMNAILCPGRGGSMDGARWMDVYGRMCYVYRKLYVEMR